MTRQNISLLVVAIVAAVFLILTPDVFLLAFAGMLLAILLNGGGHWIGSKLGIADEWGIGLFILGILVFLAAFGVLIAPAVAEQIDALAERLPDAFEKVQQRIEESAWGSFLLERINPDILVSAEGRSAAASALTSTFGALGNIVIILFIGLYGAINPGLYRHTVNLLLAPAIRQRGEEAMQATVGTLRQWLLAQLLLMMIVGVLIGFGLWFAGVPLAFALGLIAGLLAFIPNIGPVIAIVPALLLAFPEGWSTVLIVIGIYLAVQTIESYIIMPLIQQEKVALAPALVIIVQVFFGTLFGLLGLLLATPLAAAAMTLIRETYINRYLEQERSLSTVQTESGARI